MIPISPALALAVALLFAGCTHEQAPKARLAGEILAPAGVVGMMGAVLLDGHVGGTDAVLAAFSITSAIGIVLYATGELTDPAVVYTQEPRAVRNHRWAIILSGRASGAARENRCGRVRRLERRIDEYDRAVHDTMLMQDPEVIRCLTETPPTSLAPDVAPADATPLPDVILPPTVLPPTP